MLTGGTGGGAMAGPGLGAGIASHSRQPDLAGADAALGAWPGAIIELGRAGEVLGANESGRRLVEAVDGASAAVLSGLAAIAIEAGGSVRDRIGVVVDGRSRWYECVALGCEGHRAIVLGRDDTYDITIRQALFDSRQRYRDLVTISSDFAWETGPEGTFVFVSPHGALGYSAEDLLGCRPRDLLVDPDIDDSELPFHAVQPVAHAQVWLRDVDGAEACLLASAVPVLDQENAWRGVRGLCRDVTRERLRDSELARSKIREQVVAYVVNQIREEARPQAMLEAAAAVLGRATSAAAAVYSLDPAHACALSAVYGDWPEALLAEPVAAFVRDERTFLEQRVEGFRAIGRTTRYHGSVNGAVVLTRPVSARAWSDEDHVLLDAVAVQLAIGLRQIAHQRELERLSTTDGLTGLLNRRAFQEALETRLDQAERKRRPGVLLYVDLDNFKQVNDTRGHEAGDRVLREVAAILRTRSRSYDLVARIGGDEFVIWLDEMVLADAASRAGELVEAVVGLERHTDDGGRPLSASVGIAEFALGSGESLRELLKRADGAMYAAKKQGKGRWVDAQPAGNGAGRSGGGQEGVKCEAEAAGIGDEDENDDQSAA